MSADHDEEAYKEEPRIAQHHAANHGSERQRLSHVGRNPPRRCKPVLARKTATDQTAKVERVCGQQVQKRHAQLQPDHAANEIRWRDERLAEQIDVSTCTQKRGGKKEACNPISERADESERKLPHTLVGIFLAFGIGVRKKSAERD